MIIANLLIQRGPALLWVTETGIWFSAEHADLFLRYRRSYGEGRFVSEAPVHFFETQHDTDALISVLYITLGFVWGAEICSLDRSVAMTVSHDEWIEYRFAPGHEAFIPEFQRRIAPCLRQPGEGWFGKQSVSNCGLRMMCKRSFLIVSGRLEIKGCKPPWTFRVRRSSPKGISAAHRLSA